MQLESLMLDAFNGKIWILQIKYHLKMHAIKNGWLISNKNSTKHRLKQVSINFVQFFSLSHSLSLFIFIHSPHLKCVYSFYQAHESIEIAIHWRNVWEAHVFSWFFVANFALPFSFTSFESTFYRHFLSFDAFSKSIVCIIYNKITFSFGNKVLQSENSKCNRKTIPTHTHSTAQHKWNGEMI